MRQERREDKAWGMVIQGRNYSQVARTLLDDDGNQVYSNATAVRRAAERAHVRHSNPKESQFHRDKEDTILNSMLAGHLREMNTIEHMQDEIDEIKTLTSVTYDPAERMRLQAQAEAMEESRHTRRLQVAIEIRRVTESMGRVWGTTTHKQHTDISVFKSAPVDLARLNPSERRMMLEALAEDALRRAHAIPTVKADK